MKSSIILSSCFLLPIVWSVSYVALVLIGLVALAFGLGDQFYTTIYSQLGIFLYAGSTICFLGFMGYKYYNACKHKEAF